MPESKQAIQIKTSRLKTSDDIRKVEAWKQKNAASECCGEPGAPPIDWVSLWDRRHGEEMAGISSENVIALDCIVVVPKSMNPDPESFASFTRDYFAELFGDRNVLSALYGVMGGSVYCRMLIYPLDGHQLNPLRWIDSYSHNLKRDFRDAYLKSLSGFLGVDYESDIASMSNGHSKYLDNFPKVNTRSEDVREMFYTTIPPNSQVQTDLPKDRIKAISDETITAFTNGVSRGAFIKLNTGDITLGQYTAEARNYLKRMHPEMSARDIAIVIQNLSGAAAGFYVLDPLIADPKISDIKITSPDRIRVKVNGQRRTSNLTFIGPEDYFRFLDGIIQRYNLDPDSDIYVFTDKVTSPTSILRLNITMSAINSGYPILHIRKVPKKKPTIEDLIRMDVMDETTANYLLWAARNAKGIVFTGKGSSGKTTMMNTLLDNTPSDASGLVIQESEELYSYKPEMTFEHITPQYDLKALARNGLLTDIDYFIIGEIKGDEALDFIVATTTGNKAWCSVHGSSTAGGLDRLVDYIMKAGNSKYTRPQALSMLQDLQVVVFMKNFKVVEISEITGYDPVKEQLVFRQVLKRNDLISNKPSEK